MRFVYQYKTSDGERHEGEISVASREAVFTELKKQGIKPYGVTLAPGFGNWIVSLGKRVYAIAVLTVLLVIAVAIVLVQRRTVQEAVKSTIVSQEEQRTQIYGDPLVLQTCEAKGWSNVFPGALEQVLAAYAIPAKDVDVALVHSLVSSVKEPIDLNPVSIADDDPVEVAKMKRMVNWMKRELAVYIEAGGTFGSYAERLQARLAEEKRVRTRIETELELLERDVNFETEWEAKNKILRGMGMMPIPKPDEKDF